MGRVWEQVDLLDGNDVFIVRLVAELQRGVARDIDDIIEGSTLIGPEDAEASGQTG